MSILMGFAIVLLIIALSVVLAAKNRGTDLKGLLEVNVDKYTNIVDKAR